MGKKKLENSFSLLWFIQIPIRPRTIGMLIRCSFWNFTVWAGQRVLCIVWHRPLSWPLLDWYTYEHSLFQHLRSAPTQTRAPAELLFTLLGDKDKSWTAPSSIMFLPAAIKNSHTHTYNTFLPLFSLQSHNEWFHPRTPPPLSLSLQLIPEAPRFPLASFFVLSHFIPMLHSNRVIFFFSFLFFFPPPSLPLLHLGQQRPTGTYLVSVFIPTARLWPTGKLQSVICLRADKNLPFSSVLVPTLTSKHFTALCLDLRRWSFDRVSYVFVLSPLRSHFRRRFKSWHHSSQRCQCAQWAFLL